LVFHLVEHSSTRVFCDAANATAVAHGSYGNLLYRILYYIAALHANVCSATVLHGYFK